MPRRLLLIVTSIFTFLTTSNAQEIAKYAGEFMALGVGGRALGMGGTFVAIANDVTSGYYNPAGLANLNYPQLALMHSEHFGNLANYDYGAVAIPFHEDMSFGLSVMRLGIDGIPDTRNALVDGRNPDITIYDPNFINDEYARLNYDKITEFSNQDWAFYLTFAKRQSENFYWGANVKVIRRDIAEYSAMGIGFDVGAQYHQDVDLFSTFFEASDIVEKWFIGTNFQDITTTLIAWNTGTNELVSPTAKIGTGYLIELLGGYIMISTDWDVRFENRRFASQFNLGPVSFDGHAGLEWNILGLVFVRGGYSDVKQFTVGAGVKLPKLNIDYSFARFSESEIDRLPDSHRISLILTLEEPRFLRTGI